MDKMGYERGLISYNTEHALENGLTKAQMWKRVFRPRTLVYTGILWTIILVAAITLANRVPLKVNVIRDRGMPRVTETGAIDNVYKLQIMNALEQSNTYSVEVAGIPGAEILTEHTIEIPGASNRAFPVRVQIPYGSAEKGSNKIRFIIKDAKNPNVSVTEKAVFLVPR